VVNSRQRQWPKRKNDQGSFLVHESRYNVNIKILVCQIIGWAAGGSAEPVAMPTLQHQSTDGGFISRHETQSASNHCTPFEFHCRQICGSLVNPTVLKSTKIPFCRSSSSTHKSTMCNNTKKAEGAQRVTGLQPPSYPSEPHAHPADWVFVTLGPLRCD